jgi:hypothetical protein
VLGIPEEVQAVIHGAFMRIRQVEEARGVGSPQPIGELTMPVSSAPLYPPERPQLGRPSGARPERSVVRPPFGQTRPEPSPWLARSLVRTGARGRLQSELRAIAVDLLGRCQPGELPGDCAEWLATTVEAAVSGVCDSSLAALTEALDSQLGAAPPDLARRLREAEVRHDAGYI